MNASLRRAHASKLWSAYTAGVLGVPTMARMRLLNRTEVGRLSYSIVDDYPCTWFACAIAASGTLDGYPSRGPYLSPPCRPAATIRVGQVIRFEGDSVERWPAPQ